MNSPATLRYLSPSSTFRKPNSFGRHEVLNVKLPLNCNFSSNQKCFKLFTANCFFRTEVPGPVRSNRIRASSNDSQSFASGSMQREESFVEFITSERVKVVAMLALSLALCNADRVVMSVAIVPLSLSHGWCQSFAGIVQGFFVILSWMPIYFKTIYHVDLRQAAWFSAVPWSMMALTGYFAGVLSDMMIQRGISVTLTRKVMQSVGFFGPGFSLIGLTMAPSPSIASAWLTLAVGLKAFSHCGFLVNLQEIAPQYSGVLHGLSNTAGTFAAIIGTVGAGFFIELVGSFKGFLVLTAFLYFSAAVFWNVFSTGERVKFDDST